MEKFIKKIEDVNTLIYNTLHKGRSFWGDDWSDTTFYKNGITEARANFNVCKRMCKGYLDFAKFDFYWENLYKEIELKEIESPGYASRIQKYFEKYSSKIWKADYNKLMNGTFIKDLLEDGYISGDEAENYCRLLAGVHDKALEDATRAYKILLDITEPKTMKTRSHTPALDFIFHSQDNLRNRFIDFFKTKHGNLKFTATDVVQILFLALGGRDRFDALGKNELSAKYLWRDLRQEGVIGGNIVRDVSDRTLNGAAQAGANPKPEVNTAWDNFNK